MYQLASCVYCVCACQELRTPKTGSGTDQGEVTVATWQYFGDMHEVLGARPAMDPPVVVASFQLGAEDPMTILMVRLIIYHVIQYFNEFH